MVVIYKRPWTLQKTENTDLALVSMTIFGKSIKSVNYTLNTPDLVWSLKSSIVQWGEKLVGDIELILIGCVWHNPG